MREVQVAPEHYDFERYDDSERWMSYWHQLRAVLAVKPRTVLEIGPGSGVFKRYLERAGVTVKTLDIDASRGVDYVADITRLDDTLPAGLMFDAVCAFQVLEHLPLDQFEICLRNLANRSHEHVFISLPYRGLRIRWAFWLGTGFFTFGHKFNTPWRKKPIPEHYWELGWPYSARKITKKIETVLDVVHRGFVRENPYHYLWRLRRRRELTSSTDT
jgi:SAM-dependent methyltransferase